MVSGSGYANLTSCACCPAACGGGVRAARRYTRNNGRAAGRTSLSNIIATSSSISCFVSVKQNGSPLPLRTLAVGAQEPSSFQRAICAGCRF